jgi:hypothetical protein
MSLQMACNVHNPLPNQPSIVGSKHSLAMQCANPQCSKELLYLREGTLELFELESHSDDQFRPDDGAFAMKPLPSKFFWLCGECTKTHIVKRWTTSGPVLVLRNQKTAGSHPNLVASYSHRRNHAAASGVTDCPAPTADGAFAPSVRFACAAERFSWPEGRLTSKPFSNLPQRALGLQDLGRENGAR